MIRESLFSEHGDSTGEPISHPNLLPKIKLLTAEDKKSLKVSAKSSYIENIWDFTLENPGIDRAAVTLNFSVINPSKSVLISSGEMQPYLDLAKEYFHTLLFDPPAAHPKTSTIISFARKGFKSLLIFLYQNRITSLSSLTRSDLDSFLEEMSARQISATQKHSTITNRTLMSRVAGLSWLHEQSSKMIDGLIINPFENYGTAAQWASACCSTVIPRQTSTTPEIPDEIARQLFTSALKDLSIGELLSNLRSKRKNYKEVKKTINKKVTILNPFQWNEFGMRGGHDQRTLESRLMAASYIIIALLTGMRAHEILAIKNNESWLEEEVEIDEQKIKFYFVLSNTTKLQAEPTAYKWQALPIVEQAIAALNKGLSHNRRSGDYLFVGNTVKCEGRSIGPANLGRNLQRFVKAHNIIYQGKPWPLATHQFRRTYARFMIRNGLGLKELQDQLKHFDIEMTRMYGEMSIYVELQQERLILSREKYEELLISNSPIIGGGATFVNGQRKEFLGMTKEKRSLFIDNLPKTILLEQMDDGLCLYRPQTALCGGNKSACRPADCNNSLIPAAGKLKIYTWRREENLRLLDHFKGEPLKAEYLLKRITELDKLIHQLNTLDQEPS